MNWISHKSIKYFCDKLTPPVDLALHMQTPKSFPDHYYYYTANGAYCVFMISRVSNTFKMPKNRIYLGVRFPA